MNFIYSPGLIAMMVHPNWSSIGIKLAGSMNILPDHIMLNELISFTFTARRSIMITQN